MKNTRLGRGLESLISSNEKIISEININRIIVNDEQPRKKFNDLKIKSLAKSIEKNGILQPIVVRALGDKYQIVAGERRFRAARLLELENIPVIIKDLTDEQALELAIVENIERENLDPLEEIEAFKILIDKYNYTHKKLSERFNQSRSAITNKLRILSLPSNIKTALTNGEISLGHAKALLSSENNIQELYYAVIHQKLSVRKLEELIKSKDNNFKKYEEKLIKKYQEQLVELFDLDVKIIFNKDRGKIEIELKNLKDFEKLHRFLERVNSDRD